MSSADFVSRDLYLLTIEYRIYWAVAFVYALSSLSYAYFALSGNTGGAKLGTRAAWAGFLLHILLITLRTIEVERAPFQTLYESLSLFAITAVAAYLFAFSRRKGAELPGFFVLTLSSSACFFALITRSPAADPLSPPLQSYWFEWHVALAFISYAVIIVSSAIEASYLIIKPLIKRRMAPVLGVDDDSLESTRKLSYNLVLFGFPLLTFAIFSGAAWANEAWGRYWGWDPKETWSLVTWVVFTVYLHAMSVPRWKGNAASIINIVGFLCMMMTFLGVNWLVKLLKLFSMHAYAV